MTLKRDYLIGVLLIFIVFNSCGGAYKGGESVTALADGGFIKEYFNPSGQLLKRISFNSDSLKMGCYEIFCESGILLLQASFSEDLHHGWFLSFDSHGSCKEMRDLSEGVKNGFQKVFKPNGDISIEYYSNGVKHGGKMLLDSIGMMKFFRVYFSDKLLGEFKWLNEIRYNISGKLYFLDILPSPANVDELLPVIRVARIPGLRGEVAVAMQDDSLGVFLQTVPPVVYSNNMLAWALRDIHELSPDAFLVDLKLINERGDFVYRELINIPPSQLSFWN